MKKMDSLTAKYVTRSIQLLRAAEGDAIESARIINSINDRILGFVEKQYPKLKTMTDVDFLVEKIKSELAPFYSSTMPSHFAEIAASVVERELLWNTKTILKAVGDPDLKIVQPKLKSVIKAAASKPYDGRTFSVWIDRTFSSNQAKIKKTLEKGFINGDSVSSVAAEIKAISTGSTKNVKTLTRSFFMHNAVEAREEIFDINPDLNDGWIWVSVLDARTTPLICGIRDQKHYDKNFNPVGHSIQYLAGPGRIHFSCRSISVPKVKGVKQFYIDRSQIVAGDDYKKGDNITARGTVRKPNKASIDKGIFEIRQTTTKTDYEMFLKSQAKRNINFVSDILGNMDDAKRFRDGEVTLLQLGRESPVSNPINRSKL